MENDDFYKQSLLTEYVNISNNIYKMLIAQYSLGGGLILLFTFSFGNSETPDAIFLFLPFGIVLIYAATFYSYKAIIAMGGYRQSLGDELNKVTGKNIFVWESKAHEHFHQRELLTVLQGVIYITLLLTSMIYSIGIVPRVLSSNRFFTFLNIEIIRDGFYLSQLLMSMVHLLILMAVGLAMKRSNTIFDTFKKGRGKTK